MAVLTSLFSGVSGLNAFGAGLSVISNNVANLNTPGFKGGDVLFADVINQSLQGSEDLQVGRGVSLNDVRTDFTQGVFEETGNGLDLAIEGDGFLILKDAEGTQIFTRTGSLNLDKNGVMVTPAGLKLQGFQADASGALTGQFGEINLASSAITPLATSKSTIVANLNSADKIPAGAFDVNNATATSNFSTSFSVNDSLGSEHLITTYFRKSAETTTGNTWEYFVVVGSKDAQSGADTIMAQGTLGFDTGGRLMTESATTYPTGGFDFAGGATQNQVIAFDFGESVTTDGGLGLDGVTQFGAASALLNQTQNGHAAGALRNVEINQDGIVTGIFTNGKSRVLAQVVLARFNNKEGLTKLGGNNYLLSSTSGPPNLGIPNAGGAGKVLSNVLELSNVDLAQQFAKMIEYQRGFQANSRVISMSDELLQELVNLKR